MNLKATLGIAGGALATAGLSAICFKKGEKKGRNAGFEAGHIAGLTTGYQIGCRTAYNIYTKNFASLERINAQNISVDDLQSGIANMRMKSRTELEEKGFIHPDDKTLMENLSQEQAVS
ncbi:MAG: hypothetical protein GX568_09540 [Candidatus Gastranaerophilales bacterium]|mgnify:CR=1 FL=1|jgi:hypothetical protein|nr:hypothetical protein [Candidatus Gastranaerophilales bacterium]